MEHTWYCPQCGQPLNLKRDVDNATGRISYRIHCLNPKHFTTRNYPTAAQAETQLQRLLRIA